MHLLVVGLSSAHLLKDAPLPLLLHRVAFGGELSLLEDADFPSPHYRMLFLASLHPLKKSRWLLHLSQFPLAFCLPLGNPPP